jgi:glycosyltransferase involved in cell wall biosynthesis
MPPPTGRNTAHPRVVALIPAHDEAPRIAPVIARARVHLPVIVVDDGSGDDTAGVARAAGAEVVVQRPNRGKGVALRTGFLAAIERGAEAVVTLDADGQHDPDEIPRFLEAAAARPYDLVVGRRDFRRMPISRRLANTLGGVAFSWAVGTAIPDNQSGYRLVGRRLMEALRDSEERGFEFEVEMVTTCVRNGWPIGWVPIRTMYAGEASHIRPGAHLASFIRMVVAARRATHGGRDA